MNFYDKFRSIAATIRAGVNVADATHRVPVGDGDGDTCVVHEAAATRALGLLRRVELLQATELDAAAEKLRAVDPNGGWRPADVPPLAPAGAHCVEVLAVIDDPRILTPGERPYVDRAAYWPQERRWTVTYRVGGAELMGDFEIRVRCWQPMPALPADWSPLWA